MPSSTTSGWDDSSPTEPPTPSPTASGSATPQPVNSCPLGDPDARSVHPNDQRIHGGGLSFPRQGDYRPSVLRKAITWAYDVDGQDKTIQPEWFSVFVVGALRTADGFESPASAAEDVMQCSVTSVFYSGFVGRKDLFARPIRVDGKKGWALRSEIRVETPRTTLDGDVVEVIIVDLGRPESLAMFWAAVPIGDDKLLHQLDTIVAALAVDP